MHDVIVIGGGVIGLSIAWRLAKVAGEARGKIVVLDQGAIGQEASWAGAGIISPRFTFSVPKAKTPEARLRAASADLWPGYSADLRVETGIDNGFVQCGGFEIRMGGSHTALDDEIAAWRAEGVDAEPVDPDELRGPGFNLSPAITAAYATPMMGQVRNPRHLKALATACAQRGVVLKPGVMVHAIERTGDRAMSLETSEGRLQAKAFVIAAGAWAGRMLANVGCPAPIHPVRGQIVLLNASPLPFTSVVNTGPRYLVPRPDGRVLVGATQELAGFEKRNTGQGVNGLLAFAREVCPPLANATFEQAWSGLRPGSADGLPYLGHLPGFDNLYVAAGHFRAGLHLSPITAVLIAELIHGTEPSLPLEPYAPDRHKHEPGRLPWLHPE